MCVSVCDVRMFVWVHVNVCVCMASCTNICMNSYTVIAQTFEVANFRDFHKSKWNHKSFFV